MPNDALLPQAFRTSRRSEMVDVTELVQELVTSQRVTSGMVILFVPHTTAAITINENADADVKHDLLQKLETMIPKSEGFYKHAEGNSDSHVKASLVGNSVTILVEGGQLILGQWQGIYFCEFDGPRDRQMLVKIINFPTVNN